MSEVLRKAVAYFRADSATNFEADKDNLKRQQAAVEAYATAAGYEIVGTYYGATTNSAEPNAMLMRLLGHGVRIVLVESPQVRPRPWCSSSLKTC
jgi:hypothetical protein